MAEKLSRRSFCRAFGLGVLALPLTLKGKLFAQAPKAPTTELDLSDPMAKSLGYVKDASKADPKKRIDKMGVKAADQNCSNCALYKPVKGAGTENELGQCTVITTGLVRPGGWCSVWAKKVS